MASTLQLKRDVTARKKAEEHVQMLMGEVAHRSKNLLAVVQAIASRTSQSARSLDDFQRKFGLRLIGTGATGVRAREGQRVAL